MHTEPIPGATPDHVFFYTDAPRALDFHSTVVLLSGAAIDARGRIWRFVSVPSGLARAQVAAYARDMRASLTPEDFRDACAASTYYTARPTGGSS